MTEVQSCGCEIRMHDEGYIESRLSHRVRCASWDPAATVEDGVMRCGAHFPHANQTTTLYD